MAFAPTVTAKGIRQAPQRPISHRAEARLTLGTSLRDAVTFPRRRENAPYPPGLRADRVRPPRRAALDRLGPGPVAGGQGEEGRAPAPERGRLDDRGALREHPEEHR